MITTFDTITEIEVQGEGVGLLDDMCKVIGNRCELIERVRTRLTQPHLGNLVLAVDESGLYHDVETNVLATLLYNPGWRPGKGQAGSIAGHALVFREEWNLEDGGMDFASVKDGDLDVVRKYLAEVVV